MLYKTYAVYFAQTTYVRPRPFTYVGLGLI